MKKLLISVVVIAAIAFFVAPYFTGKFAESETVKIVEQMNLSPLEYGTTEILSYERGYRSTDASFRYRLPSFLQSLTGEDTAISYKCAMQHGVTGVDYTCTLFDNPGYDEFVKGYLEGKDPLSLIGSVSMLGGLSQTVQIEAIENLKSEDGTLNMSRTELTVDSDMELSSFDISGGLDTLEFNQNGETMSLSDIRLDGDIKKSDVGMLIGDSTMSIASVNAKSAMGEVSMKDFKVASDTSLSGENINSVTTLKLDSFSMPGLPFEKIENTNMLMKFNGLNAEAVVEYQELAQKLQRDAFAAMENGEESPMPGQQMQQLIPILERMVSADTLVELSLSTDIDSKPSSAGIVIDLNEKIKMQDMEMFMMAPQEAFKKLTVSVDASLDKALIDAQPMLAGPIGQSPMFVADSNSYKASLKLGEQPELNGKKMTFEELQMMLMPQQPQQ